MAEEAEASYKAIVENSRTAVVVVQDEKVVYVNLRTCEQTGYTREEVLGTSIWDYLHPDEVAEVADAQRRRLAGEDIPTDRVVRAVTKSGEIKYFDLRATPIQHKGAPAILLNLLDVTDNVRAQQAVAKSEHEFRDLVEKTSDWVWQTDENSIYTYSSPRSRELLGYEPEEIVGRSSFDLMSPEEAKRVSKLAAPILKKREPFTLFENALLHRDGHLVMVETSAEPVFNDQGEFRGYRGTDRDITERKKAEQALQEAEEKYRSLVEETIIGVFMVQNDQLVYANPRVLEIVGTESQDFIGKSPLEFVAPQDRASVADHIRELMHKKVRSSRLSFRVLRRDGALIDVEVHSTLTTYMGAPAIMCSAADITERARHMEALKDSEERYRQLFEHSPDMLFLISAQTGTFIAMNPAVTQVLGYAPYDVLGKSPCDISPEFQPDGSASDKMVEKLLARQIGAPAQRFEWVHKRKDGTLADCEVSLIGYRFHGEDLIQAIVRDVTERKRSEETRRTLECELDKQKRSFYRETILSVTDDTLDICDWSDIEPFIMRSKESVEVNETSEIAKARSKVAEFCRKHGLQGDRLHDFVVAVGEAATNAIKHGACGNVYVGEEEDSVWVVISDKGGGIESLILPRAVLLRGFSTKPSLGLGYSIMLEVCDRILLCTGEHGTTVVLIKNKVAHASSLGGEYLPDTWNSIPG